MSATRVASLLEPFKGHRMAKAALEMAVLDAELRTAGLSFGSYLGAERDAVPAGVSVGIQPSVAALLDAVGGYLDEGYLRIKLKIKPGWDVEPVRAVRERFGDDVLLQVDANAAYTLAHAPLLAAARRLRPAADRAAAGRGGPDRARRAGAAGRDADLPRRVDRQREGGRRRDRARRLLDRQHQARPRRRLPGGAPDPRRLPRARRRGLVRGMLESGLGRAANVALAALPGFVLPGDTSASDRYYAQDITAPFVLEDGHVAVPDRARARRRGRAGGAGADDRPQRVDRMRPSLALPDREAALRHASQLILASWRSFDHAREREPRLDDGHRAMLRGPLPERGEAPARALDEAAVALDLSLSPARPRYLAYVGSSGLEIGVLGDALAAAYDVNVAVASGGADLIESQAVAWVGEFVGFGAAADGLLAPGGTIANLTALTAARERALPGVRHRGVQGRTLAVYCSQEAHYSIRRAAEVLGVGGDHVRAIPVDRRRRIDVAACEAAIEADRRRGIVPVAIVATAGTTLTGAVDDLDALADVAARTRVWLHVDGAYGLPAAATETAGAHFRGLARADSATVDAHKWLYVPKACSVLLVRDRSALERTFAHEEAYIPHDDASAVDLHAVDRTLEYSRPLRALKLWLAFRVHGAAAIRAAIERNLDQARLLARLIDGHPDLERLSDVPLSAVCFRHRSCAGEDGADRTARLVEAIRRDGRVLLAAAAIDGRPCLRACVVNFRTRDEDMHVTVAVVCELAERLAAERPAVVARHVV